MPENNLIIETASEEKIKLLSTEVQEIISYRPNWIVRNGSLLFLAIVGSLFACTFFIHYPDIVTSRATFNSINAPKEIQSKIDGKLAWLNAAEGKQVKANDIVGFMESRANHRSVIFLSSIIDSMQFLIQSGQTKESIDKLNNILSQQNNSAINVEDNLGELQQAFQTFILSFSLFKQYLSTGFYLQKRKMLQGDIAYFQKQHSILLEQKKLQEEDLDLAKATIEANSTLHQEKVISPLDYRNEKSKFISKQMSIPQMKASITTNESSQHEKQKEILQLDNEIAQQQSVFVQALNTFKAQADDWKNKYLLVAPVDGKISFAGFVQENQQLKNGQTVCFINPGNTTYFATVIIPQANFGKVKQGQKILFKLPAYLYQEFGVLKGELSFISNIPTDSGYAAKVLLPEGFITSYKKQLLYKEGLQASGEIITNDVMLIERLTNQFISLIKNR